MKVSNFVASSHPEHVSCASNGRKHGQCPSVAAVGSHRVTMNENSTSRASLVQ